jgi:hypothetical protein
MLPATTARPSTIQLQAQTPEALTLALEPAPPASPSPIQVQAQPPKAVTPALDS